jgi:hypothetical protein
MNSFQATAQVVGVVALIGLASSCAAHAQPATDFQQGYAARDAWEGWFAQQGGEYRAGAYWWSGQRSLPVPGSCDTLGGNATAGCLDAKAMLDPADARRKASLAYRQGWNAWAPTTMTAPVPAPTPVAPPAPPSVTADATPPQYVRPGPNESFLHANPGALHDILGNLLSGTYPGEADMMRSMDAACKDMSPADQQQWGLFNKCQENHRQLVERGWAR